MGNICIDLQGLVCVNSLIYTGLYVIVFREGSVYSSVLREPKELKVYVCVFIPMFVCERVCVVLC